MKIIFCKKLPQWIISSDTGAYFPKSKTMYVKKDKILKMLKTLIHELKHYLIDKFNLPKSWHGNCIFE